MSQLSFHSPVGDLTISEEDGEIVSVDWGWSPISQADVPVLEEAKRQLDEYFAGKRQDFDLPLSAQGTEFQRRVWSAMAKIPYGETLTYGQLAKQVRSGPRAIGGACGRNPIPIVIPCHRVVGAAGLTGYSGEGWLDTKKFLLDLECCAGSLAHVVSSRHCGGGQVAGGDARRGTN
jgi:methylated-DNA-[protein]-cysteine S-methyltransferase